MPKKRRDLGGGAMLLAVGVKGELFNSTNCHRYQTIRQYRILDPADKEEAGE
jgi:hypothetical protein